MITVNNSTIFKRDNIITWVNSIVILDKYIFMQNYQNMCDYTYSKCRWWAKDIIKINETFFWKLRDQNGEFLKITAL